VDKISTALNGGQWEDAELVYFCGFDADGSRESQQLLLSDLEQEMTDKGINISTLGDEAVRDIMYTLYGGLFFLGLFLGVLFIMATVLIIYYKQIAEGYDDKERFEIMQKVGMSHQEVKKSIHSQVLTVFFLPLVTAVIHLVFAFPVITKMLATLNLTNVKLFAVCTGITILVFALFYTLVYMLTARTYYKIVSPQ